MQGGLQLRSVYPAFKLDYKRLAEHYRFTISSMDTNKRLPFSLAFIAQSEASKPVDIQGSVSDCFVLQLMLLWIISAC